MKYDPVFLKPVNDFDNFHRYLDYIKRYKLKNGHFLRIEKDDWGFYFRYFDVEYKQIRFDAFFHEYDDLGEELAKILKDIDILKEF